MKKFTKICLITIAACLVLGFGCLIAGITLGGTWGQMEEAFENGDFTISSKKISRSRGTALTKSVTELEKGENINQIEVDMKSGGFYLLPSDDGSIRVQIEEDKGKATTVRKNGNELIIENDFRAHNGAVTIYCPANMQLRELDISIDGGEAILSVPLQMQELSVEIGAGRFECNELLQAVESDWEVGAGEIQLNTFAGSHMEFECGMGSIAASIQGREQDYSYDLHCKMGEIRVGDIECGGIGQREVNHRGDYHGDDEEYLIEAECGMGSVEIDFVQKI